MIAVQARTDSSRFPGKVHAPIEGKALLDWVLDSCRNAIRYLRRDQEALHAEVDYCLLVPEGDPLATIYQNKMTVFQGSKEDVLSRYHMILEPTKADYVVRITGDCQSIPTHLIAKHIKSALIRERDLTTNTIIRSFKEGYDVQIFSKRLLDFLNENAKSAVDREHVGTYLDKVPFPFHDKDGKPNICHVISEFYEPEIKTSIDTKEDLDRAIERERALKNARAKAIKSGVIVV